MTERNDGQIGVATHRHQRTRVLQARPVRTLCSILMTVPRQLFLWRNKEPP